MKTRAVVTVGILAAAVLLTIALVTGDVLTPYATIEGVAGVDGALGVWGVLVGDVNGDSFPDLIAPSPGHRTARAVRIFFGDVTGQVNPVAGATILNPGPADNRFGTPFMVGDLNGDGIDDIAVGAWAEDYITTTQDTFSTGGAVYIYFGSTSLSGDVTTPDIVLQDPEAERPGHYITPDPSLRFGWSIQIGDYNGDGVEDLVVSEAGGAYSYIVTDPAEAIDTTHALPDTVENWSFRYLYLGPLADGATPDYRLGNYWHNQQGAWYGMQTGDWNGDGIDDLVVSCYGAYDIDVQNGRSGTAQDTANFEIHEQYGKFIFYFGASDLSGWETWPDLVIPKQDTTRGDLSRSSELFAYLFNPGGFFTQGDYNGDGITDFLSSNIWPRDLFGYESGLPLKQLFLGGSNFDNISDGGLGTQLDPSAPPKAWRGGWASSVGDINGDGYDDYIWSSHNDSIGVVDGETVKGRYFVYMGGPTVRDALAFTIEPDDPEPGSGFGLGIGRPLWDMDGDGINEFLLVAHAWGDSSQGKLYIYSGNASFPVTSVEEDPRAEVPGNYELHQNYPNPFNPSTTISYSLPVREDVRLEIYNLMGQKVRTLVDGTQNPGTHRVEWNGRDDAGNPLGSGVYFYKLISGKQVQTKKMVLVK
jgi:hypothetical protein